jgi:hypothetical protein
MVRTHTQKSYINTLIFVILTSIISLILLYLLYIDILKPYLYFVVGFEAGTFLLIFYIIYKIIKYEQNITNNKDLSNLIIDFNQCPDLYTKRMDKRGRPYCVNEHRIKDKSGEYKTLKTYPNPHSTRGNPYVLPKNLDNTPPTDNLNSTKYDKFYLDTLDNGNLKTNFDKCSPIWNEPNDKTSLYTGFTVLPWTTVRSKCDNFVN